MTDLGVLRHVIEAITPASAAHGDGARRHVTGANAALLERLAITLGGAQHTARPRSAHRTIVVCAGDHGVGDPGLSLGAAHPTAVAAHAIVDGSAALAQVARQAGAAIVLVDAGTREPEAMPATAIRLGRGAAAMAPARAIRIGRADAEPRGHASGDLMAGAAMSREDAAASLEAGIALAVSLADGGLDLLAVGALGVGADVASAALLGSALGAPPTGLADPVAEAAGARGAAWSGADPLDLLAAFGGGETGVLAGLMLAAASTHVPVILDGYATGAAALVAAAFAPRVSGYLIAAHTGAFTQPRILAHLGLHPVFDVGLGHGEGTGAAMILPLIDQVTALAARG